ncbi:MAG TPA: pseudouridine-5'-phosphate glycosidase [Sporichthyaceae bacterium]|jgi:pseudouridine-5'-phosphate glycosidase
MTRVHLHPHVARALAAGGPVVALESTVLTHGLPAPDNLALAQELERTVLDAGATPAIIAVLRGQARIGLDRAELDELCADPAATKLSTRDLAPALVKGTTGGTTVAATAHLAARAGIRVFATGGIGGVHRGAAQSWDVSADLDGLARTPIAVVCSGAKSVLDVGATVERLETLGVLVLGYQSAGFPQFYLADTDYPLDWLLRSPEEAAETLAAHWDLGLAGVLVTNPVPAEAAMDPGLHDRALRSALAAAQRERGKAVTPVMLEHFHQTTGGASLVANIALLRSNAEVAARIAVALASRSRA